VELVEEVKGLRSWSEEKRERVFEFLDFVEKYGLFLTADLFLVVTRW
jgi:hypothetical protein